MNRVYLLLSLALMSLSIRAAPLQYNLDPEHTYPSIEADHFGLSIWRGKFNKSSGKLLLDKAARTGEVEVTIELSSVDFGHDKLNAWMISDQFFDAAKFPTATFKGALRGISPDTASELVGSLTLRGVTRPITLRVSKYKCIEHPIYKRDYCGADASGSFQRDEFGLDAGKPYGFSMEVVLRIQVEAIAAE